ncbi:MAG: hypothetical protein AB8F78_08370 [Saprospiraceae bacterium]
MGCSTEELIPTSAATQCDDNVTNPLQSRGGADGSSAVIDPILSASKKAQRIAYLSELIPENYPSNPDVETFVWDLEYFSNQDNFTGITKDRHHTVWSRLEIPLAVTDAGVSNATSQMSSIRSTISAEVQTLLTSVGLADNDKWFEISSVFAKVESSGVNLSVIIGGGTNLELCVNQGDCPEGVDLEGSFYTSFILCNAPTGDYRHFNSGGCTNNTFSEAIKFASGAVAITTTPLGTSTRTPYSCNPIAANQYYQQVEPLNNIVTLGSGPGDYPNPNPDNTTCTRESLVYLASECNSNCDGQDLTCISQADFSDYFLPNTNSVVSMDRLLLGSGAKFFAFSQYSGESHLLCDQNGQSATYYSFLESQYVID